MTFETASRPAGDRYIATVEAFDMQRFIDITEPMDYLGQYPAAIAASLMLYRSGNPLNSVLLYDILAGLHGETPVTGYPIKSLTRFLGAIAGMRMLHKESGYGVKPQEMSYTFTKLGEQVLLPAAGWIGQLLLEPDGFPAPALFSVKRQQNTRPLLYRVMALNHALDQGEAGCNPKVVSKAYHNVMLAEIRKACRVLAEADILEEKEAGARYILKPEYRGVAAGLSYVVAGLMARDERVIAQGTLMAEALSSNDDQLASLIAA